MASKIAKAVRLYRQRRTAPLRLELNLTQACNLNCNGCTHYAPLAPANNAIELATIRQTLAHLSQIKGIERLESLYLMGGETLLYPNLEAAIAMARRYFPVTPISLFTNGILLPQMKDSFWQACQQHHIAICITRYPINIDYDALFRLAKSKGVKAHQFADRNVDNTFFRFPLDPAKRQPARRNHFTCFNFGCISIIGDRIFPCSISACVDLLNNQFGTEFTHKKGDFLMVDEVSNVNQLFKLRNHPVPFCAYCAKPQPTTYSASRREASEWVNTPD